MKDRPRNLPPLLDDDRLQALHACLREENGVTFTNEWVRESVWMLWMGATLPWRTGELGIDVPLDLQLPEGG